jgi:hypothetical protein
MMTTHCRQKILNDSNLLKGQKKNSLCFQFPLDDKTESKAAIQIFPQQNTEKLKNNSHLPQIESSALRGGANQCVNDTRNFRTTGASKPHPGTSGEHQEIGQEFSVSKICSQKSCREGDCRAECTDAQGLNIGCCPELQDILPLQNLIFKDLPQRKKRKVANPVTKQVRFSAL